MVGAGFGSIPKRNRNVYWTSWVEALSSSCSNEPDATCEYSVP
jgi:hypothetical protein